MEVSLEQRYTKERFHCSGVREREKKNGGKEGELSRPTLSPRSFFLRTLFCAVSVLLEQAGQELDLLHHHTHYKKRNLKMKFKDAFLK